MRQNSPTTDWSRSERRRQLPAILTLLLNTGLMWFGFFMLIPLVALHATRDLGISAAVTGLVLAVRQFVQQGLGVFIAAAADWLGYRRMMLCGALIRALGFAYLAVAMDVLHLMLAGIVAAIGGACFESSGKAAMVSVSRGYSRETIFSLTATVGNIGMTSGPLLGVALLDFDFKVVGLTSAAIYLACFALIFVFVPPIPPVIKISRGQQLGPARLFRQLGQVWQNRAFVLINVIFAGYYILYVQINITLPLFTTQLTGSKDNIALLYAVNSGLAIALQFLSVKLLLRWFKPITIVGIGTGLAALGLVGVGLASNLAGLLFGVVIYSLGRLIVEPMGYSIAAKYATDETLASYFGFSALALAVGGVIGNSLGGWLFDLGNQTGFVQLCWLVFGAIGGGVVAGVVLFQRHEAERQTLNKIEMAVASPADQQ